MPAVVDTSQQIRAYNPGAPTAAANIAPNARPLLRVHPEQWETVQIEAADGKGKPEHALVPQISVDWDVAGVNGVKDTSNGGGNFMSPHHVGDPGVARQDMVAKRQRAGFVFLPPDLVISKPEHLPPGCGPRPIVVETPTAKGAGRAEGTHYATAWSTIEAQYDGSSTRVDHKSAMYRWLRDMARSNGLGLGKLSARWERDERRRLQSRLAKLHNARANYSDASFAPKLAALQADLDAFEAAVAAQRKAEGAWK